MIEDPSFLLMGAGVVVGGLTAASLIVWRDLAPTARLSPAQRITLTAALGIGVIAFGLKLAVIETLSLAGRDRLAPTITEAVPEEVPEPSVAAGRPVWEALPSVAPHPADDPPTSEKVALGERLFHDPLLSRDGTLSCASCHDLLKAAGGDGRPVAEGVGGAKGARNSPTVWNAAFQARLFWDGRAKSLEEQALGPIGNPIEMGNPDLDAVAARVAARPGYREAFAAAFGADAPIDPPHLARALAAFERTLVTADTPFDRFVDGDTTALSPRQIRGMSLFETVGCIVCHAGPAFSRASFLAPDGGRGALRIFPSLPSPLVAAHRLDEDSGAAAAGKRGVWRVPSLRNVALTGPWFHNGAVDDLAEAVRVMAVTQTGRVLSEAATLEPEIEWSPERRRLVRITPTPLSERDVADIVAFLEALSSDRLKAAQSASPPATP